MSSDCHGLQAPSEDPCPPKPSDQRQRCLMKICWKTNCCAKQCRGWWEHVVSSHIVSGPYILSGTEGHTDGSQNFSPEHLLQQDAPILDAEMALIEAGALVGIRDLWILFALVSMKYSGVAWGEYPKFVTRDAYRKLSWSIAGIPLHVCLLPTMLTLGSNGHWIISYVSMMTCQSNIQFDLKCCQHSETRLWKLALLDILLCYVLPLNPRKSWASEARAWFGGRGGRGGDPTSIMANRGGSGRGSGGGMGWVGWFLVSLRQDLGGQELGGLQMMKNGDWCDAPAFYCFVVCEQYAMNHFIIFHSCQVMSCHVSSAHVCYVQVDEAELSPSATLNYMCTAGIDHWQRWISRWQGGEPGFLTGYPWPTRRLFGLYFHQQSRKALAAAVGLWRKQWLGSSLSKEPAFWSFIFWFRARRLYPLSRRSEKKKKERRLAELQSMVQVGLEAESKEVAALKVRQILIACVWEWQPDTGWIANRIWLTDSRRHAVLRRPGSSFEHWSEAAEGVWE